MPRAARLKSNTHIYHVIVRGNNRQAIFQDERDYHYYFKCLFGAKNNHSLDFYAYCLMPNHVHLLVYDPADRLSDAMRQISTKYVYYYNHKYGRVGYLFQDRFKSFPVETETYALTLVRYINQNPIRAGLERTLGAYPYNSYADILSGIGSLVNPNFAKSFFASSEQLFEYFSTIVPKMTPQGARISDAAASELMAKYCKCKSPSDFAQMDSSEQIRIIQIMLRLQIPASQIVRITGVSKYLVRKASEALHHFNVSETPVPTSVQASGYGRGFE